VTAPEKPKPKLKIPWWVDPIMVVIGVGLVIYVVMQFPFDDIMDAVRGMFPAVALTPLIALAWFCTSTTAMWLLLDRRVAWSRVLWIRLVGDSYNALLPLAGYGGEPFKIVQLSRDVDMGTVMATLIRDRLVDNAIGFLYGGTEIACGLAVYAVDSRLEVGLFGYLVACLLLGIAGMVLTRTRVPGRIGGWLANIVGGTAPDRISPLPWPRLAMITVCYLGSRTLGMLEKLVLLWCLGLPHDLVTAAFVDGFCSAAGYVGFMIPQGLGVFETATVYLVGVLGGPGAAGVAFAFARRGRMLVVGLFGISLHAFAVAWRAIRRTRDHRRR
jgi:hypothetical protein